MAAQPLGSAVAALTFDRLEHGGHGARIVARSRHQLRAEQIRFALEFAAVLQEVRAESQLRGVGDRGTLAATHDRAEHLAGERAKLKLLAFRRLHRAVTQDHVRQLVRHDPGNFPFRARRLNHAAIQEHRPAGQGERVDLTQVHDLERVPELRLTELARDLVDEPFPNALDEIFRAIVIEHRHLPAHLGGGLASELHVLLGGIAVLLTLDARLRRCRRRDRERQHGRNCHQSPGRCRMRANVSSHAPPCCNRDASQKHADLLGFS